MFCRCGQVPNQLAAAYSVECSPDPERNHALGGCKRDPLQPGWEP